MTLPITSARGAQAIASQTPGPHLATSDRLQKAEANDRGEMREAFDRFVGETFFGQMLSAMRKTVGKPAYFHGGRGEEVFQGQLDQILSQEMAEATAESFADPMFELFSLPRPS